MAHSITLRSGLASELDGLAYLRESLKLTARALFYRRQTARWMALLNSHPMFGDMLPTCPRLVNKIYRSYFSTALGCDDRLRTLKLHYRFIIRHNLAALVARAARYPVELCRLPAKTDVGYRIVLRAAGVLDREGELILQLMHGNELVYSAAFSFLNDAGRIAIGVGCIQGPPGAAGLDRIRDATRELHGMRPKNLLLRLIRQFGHDVGCRELVLVGNRNRVVTMAARKGLVHADYDSLWKELQAWQRPGGDYGLLCEDLPEPAFDSIPSKKRSEARKRHAMLSHAIATIRATVAREKRTAMDLRLMRSANDPVAGHGLRYLSHA